MKAFFRKWLFLEKRSSLLCGAHDADNFEVGYQTKLSSASPNPPQLIKEGFLDVLVLLDFFSVPFLENFLPTPLIITVRVKYSKTKPFIILAVLHQSV